MTVNYGVPQGGMYVCMYGCTLGDLIPHTGSKKGTFEVWNVWVVYGS